MTTLPTRAAAVITPAASPGSRGFADLMAERELMTGGVTSQVCATRNDAHRVVCIFDDPANSYPGTGGTGTRPNLAGVRSFHVPTLTSAVVRAGGVIDSVL